MTNKMQERAIEISFDNFIKNELENGTAEAFISMLKESKYFKKMWETAFESGVLFSEMLQERIARGSLNETNL
jgi:hypothetical protein